MEVITIESQAWKDLLEKIDNIEAYIHETKREELNLDEMYVDGYEVCKHLRISRRTLQRLRSGGIITYSVVGGKCYYTIAEIKRLLKEKQIRRSDEYLNDLISHYQSHINKKK